MLVINRIKKLKTNSKLLLLISVILVSVSIISFVQSASFEIADQPEPTVSNTSVTPGTEDRGNSVAISSKVIDVSGVTYVKTQIKNGFDTIVANIDLYDDGTHSDSAAGDNIYGNTWTIPISFSAGNYKIFITASDTLGNVYQTGVTTPFGEAGPRSEETNFNVTVPVVTCPDGSCDAAGGECSSCPIDCTVADCCGTDISCNVVVGEDCSSCSTDCGCVAPNICCSGTCQLPACVNNSDCPTDGDLCTNDTCNNGGACDAFCSYPAVSCDDGSDGCCPAGCSDPPDTDCAAICVTDGSCDSNCPIGCTVAEDPDCSGIGCCGDGTCDAGEDCLSCATDCSCVAPNICCSGTCQLPACANNSDCDDSDSCTTDTCNNPNTCSAICSNPSVGCIDDDGCCPAGCDAANDNNCSAICATDGLCDSNCPAGCTVAEDPDCGCQNDDSCCGIGCDATNDNNCGCTPFLTCDDYLGQCGTALSDGCNNILDCSGSCISPNICCSGTCQTPTCANNSDCPDDGDSCTTSTCNNPNTCSATCSNPSVGCVDDDGCCPTGCDAANDNNCLAVSIQNPTNGLEFTSGDLVDFEGFVLGGIPDYIYEWSSDEDLFLSNDRVFSSRNLSVNVHTITLKVTDGNAVIAQDSVSITVQPEGTLTARIILEQTEFFLNYGYFFASSISSGGTGAYTYQWKLDSGNNFSTDKLALVIFSTSCTDNDGCCPVGCNNTNDNDCLSVDPWTLGTHTITLTVTDGAGNTTQDTKIINVINQTLLTIYPSNGEHFIVGQPVTFSVTRTVGYNLVSAKWTSDLDGPIGTGFAFQKNDLSIGLHTITLELEDAMNVFLGTVTTKTFQIQIDPVPTICNEDWNCTEWSSCSLGNRTRVCTDNNFCGTVSSKPNESDSCTVPTSSFDWRDNAGDWMTPIRNQEDCGSCWAFAVLGSVEAKYNIQNDNINLDEDLSEQDLISCSYAGNCSGGISILAMEYLKDVGINNEACFSYQSDNVACSNKCAGWQNNLWKIDEPFSDLNALTQVIKDRLINDGPLVVSYHAVDFANPLDWGGWLPGTRSCDNDATQNHAVVIVGYDDAGGNGYWIVRNSWGTDWIDGDAGYFEVLYGECGIEGKISYPNKVLSP